MSESVTVHLRGQIGIDDLRQSLEHTIGHGLSKVKDIEWDAFRATCLGLEFTLYESRDFEDDCGIPFSVFAFVVSIDCLSDSIEHEHAISFQELAARVVARSCWDSLECECMIVRNLQRHIESYPRK